MFTNKKEPFKNKTSKELVKFFKPVVPEPFILSMHEIFYMAEVGMLCEFGTDHFQEMMEAFNVYLGTCEKIMDRVIEEEDKLLRDNPAADIKNWTYDVDQHKN